MKDLSLKISFGSSIDTFLAKYRLFFRVIKFIVVMIVFYSAVHNVLSLKSIPYEDRLDALLGTILYIVIIKIVVMSIVLCYNIPQTETLK